METAAILGTLVASILLLLPRKRYKAASGAERQNPDECSSNVVNETEGSDSKSEMACAGG